jgi:hypothetical protein
MRIKISTVKYLYKSNDETKQKMTIKRQRYHTIEKMVKNNFLLKIKVSRTGILTALIFLFFAGTSADTFAQAWFNNSWSYRKSHVINLAAGAGTNYQVQVTVNYGSGTDAGGAVYCNSLCKTDFTDIRFTAADGTTLLSHWIQSSTVSNNAVFWVKIPGDLSAANQTIYMYYGAAATTVSSGTNTFIYYDDGSSNTGWTGSTTFGTTLGTSSVLGNPVNSFRAVGTGPVYMYRNTGIVPNTFTFFNVYTVTANLGNFFFQCNSAGLGQMYRLDSRGTTNYTGFATTTNWITWATPGASQTSSANTWYQFGIAINSSGTSSTLYYNAGTGTNPVPGTVLGTFTSTNSGTYIGLVGDGGGSGLFTYWDNIITRKYVSPEPAHSTWGAQELPPITFSPASGCQGVAGIVITGTNFTGATAVTFNGVPAGYTVNSSTQITATVPLSATTGIITVTAPTGIATSLSSFTVNALPAASAIKTNISCFNANNGTITVSGSGGSGSYTYYSISNGLPPPIPNGYQASPTFNGFGPGQYKIRVIDSNGCESKPVQ